MKHDEREPQHFIGLELLKVVFCCTRPIRQVSALPADEGIFGRMTIKDAIYSVVLLAVGFAIGWLTRPTFKVASTTSRIDTLIHFQPAVIRSTATEFRTFTFPKLIFAPKDTVERTVVIERGDSVAMTFPIERREYGDGTYRAVVTGAVVGDVHPTLEEIEVYAHSTTQTVVQRPRAIRFFLSGAFAVNRQAFSAGGGVLIKEHHGVKFDVVIADKTEYYMLGYMHLF